MTTVAEPSPAQIRDVLREHGIPVPEKGRLGAEHRARYNELVAVAGPPPAGFGPGPGDDGEFDPAGPGDDGDEAPAPRAELAPARPRATRSGWLGGGKRRKAQGGSQSRKRKPRKPPRDRISLAPLGSRIWDAIGRGVYNVLPATGRCIAMEAPLFGVIAEDSIRDTWLDPLAQPLAQVEEKAERLAAVVMTPICVAGIEIAQGLPEDERNARVAMIEPVLAECLVILLRAEDNLGDRMAAIAQDIGPLKEQVQRTMNRIFYGTDQPPGPGPGSEQDAGPDDVATAQAAAGVPV